MACEGKSLTARDLAEITAKAHHPEGQDAREVPEERRDQRVRPPLGTVGVFGSESSKRQQWLGVL